jgi:hypothetical protein
MVYDQIGAGNVERLEPLSDDPEKLQRLGKVASLMSGDGPVVDRLGCLKVLPDGTEQRPRAKGIAFG